MLLLYKESRTTVVVICGNYLGACTKYSSKHYCCQCIIGIQAPLHMGFPGSGGPFCKGLQ